MNLALKGNFLSQGSVVYNVCVRRRKIQVYALVECMTRLKGMYSLWPKVHKWYMCLGSGAFFPRCI
ncbi:hypothetical protein APHNP_0603 [Anaplasma phagocytophilum str. ApNP]|uniref:Uncharacterized protein n=1 Tax=Anaplasma phagocytophilum str. ApNP TaxID=1359153 RepID=A0A0F3NL54_ANAPH|nr:hypothetical protein APHNP_0603 [Anaplasma phagocytophilum str. ApNP]